MEAFGESLIDLSSQLNFKFEVLGKAIFTFKN